MGCVGSREHRKIEEGLTCCEDSPAISSLCLFLVLKDPKFAEFYNKKIEFFHDYLIILRFNDITRSTNFGTIRDNCSVSFEFRLNFDETHFKALNSSIEFELVCNDMFSGKILIKDLKTALFFLKNQETTLKSLNNQEISAEFHYGWLGEIFENIKSLSNEMYKKSEQTEILYNILKNEREPHKTLDFHVKNMLSQFLDKKTKETIYETLISEKNPRILDETVFFQEKAAQTAENHGVFDVLELLLADFDPYFLYLDASFKSFLQNIVAYDDRFDDFVVETIKKNTENYLVYQNFEAFRVMLKEMFRTNEDPAAYFTTFSRSKHANSSVFDEFFASNWLFAELLLPHFNKDPLNALKLCNILDNFDKFEDYFLSHAEKLAHIDFDVLFVENEHARVLNLLRTPEFHDISLKVLSIEGHAQASLSPFLGSQDPQSIVLGKTRCFSSNIGESSDLIVVCEQTQQKTMFLSHVYLYHPGKNCDCALKKAMFFVSDSVPEKERLQAFAEMKFEQFTNKELGEEKTLVYCGTINLEDEREEQLHEYKEIHFENLIKGRFLVVWCLEAVKGSNHNMDIGKLGCLGFVSEEHARKFNPKTFKSGRIRVRSKV